MQINYQLEWFTMIIFVIIVKFPSMSVVRVALLECRLQMWKPKTLTQLRPNDSKYPARLHLQTMQATISMERFEKVRVYNMLRRQTLRFPQFSCCLRFGEVSLLIQPFIQSVASRQKQDLQLFKRTRETFISAMQARKTRACLLSHTQLDQGGLFGRLGVLVVR